MVVACYQIIKPFIKANVHLSKNLIYNMNDFNKITSSSLAISITTGLISGQHLTLISILTKSILNSIRTYYDLVYLKNFLYYSILLNIYFSVYCMLLVYVHIKNMDIQTSN